MPLKNVICPDGKECTTKECLTRCRLEEQLVSGRCMSLPTLYSVLQERPWAGKPSTTQLLQGTRELFLKITQDYSIDPQQQVFAMYGSSIHSKLETITVAESLKEERLYDEYSSGAFDYFDKKTNSLWDFKTYGSFKAAKIIGIGQRKIPIGTFKNGNTKYKTLFTEDGHKDKFELAIQLNDYRTKLELYGYMVDNMFCEILLRDGNTMVAKNRGLFKNTYIVKVNKISDNWLEKWKRHKYNALMFSLKTGELPKECTKRERWEYFDEKSKKFISNKCRTYCQVADFCDRGRKEKGEEEDVG